MSEIMREKYCNYIEARLTELQERLTIRVAGNLTDLHVYAEAIMTSVLNQVFNVNLKNANIMSPNAPGIDLVDDLNNIVVQVSTDASRNKIQTTLTRGGMKPYEGYRLIFLFLVSRHPAYKNAPFDNPNGIEFNVDEDVYDLGSLMSRLRTMDIRSLEVVYDNVKREFRNEYGDTSKLTRGLSAIVSALINKDPEEKINEQPIAFRIEEKIQKNSLIRTRQEIQELSALTYPLDGIYNEYERESVRRVRSVFHHLQMVYRSHLSKGLSSDDVYIATVDTIVEELDADLSLDGYSYEDVEFYVSVVVVDAFMRCKIFEGPNVWEGKR